jgi:8-oxo-dGTP pyrophosphatase MutT (NUDIX family)
MKMNIRAKAIVIFKQNDKYLFTVCHDRVKDELFYIPVGGGIEFGEHSLEAAKREVKEEIGREIGDEKLLSVTENIFEFKGICEHEIVFTYYAEFMNKEALSLSLKAGINDAGEEIKLVWATLQEIQQKNIRVYPYSLLKILTENT